MTCPSCGKRVGKTAAFCAYCGTPLRPDVEAPAPVTAAPEVVVGEADPAAGPGLQRWMVTDWPLAILCVAVWLAIAIGGGAFVGLAAGLVAHGPDPNALLGLVAGAWLPFAGLGSDVIAVVSNDEALVGWFTSGLAPTTTVGLAALAWWILRTALPRVAPDRDFTLAFVAKVAVLGAVAVAVAGSVASLGDPDLEPGSGFQVGSQSSSAEPALWALLLLVVVGLLAARGRLQAPGWWSRASWLRPVRVGLVAWLVAVLVLGLGTSVAGIVASDDATEGFAGAVVAPVVLGNTGVAAQAFAVGASVETLDSDDIEPFDRDVDEHISLFHYDVPPDDDSDAAPLWVWPVVVVSPLVAFAAARRWLRRTEPADGSAVLLQGAGLAGGFALGAWFGGVAAPLYAGAASIDFSSGSIDDVDLLGRTVVGRPAVAATVGLSLVWALVGVLPAVMGYARRHGIDLIASSSSGAVVAPTGTGEPEADAEADPEV